MYGKAGLSLDAESDARSGLVVSPSAGKLIVVSLSEEVYPCSVLDLHQSQVGIR